jgi:menaquinone-dependent protoporphyrinogen oxidase
MDKEHQEARKITSDFPEHIGWKPLMTTQLAGALKYTQYGFFTRLVMKKIAKREGRTTDTSKDHEYTDWDAVREFVAEFLVKIKVHPITYQAIER